MTSLGLKCSGKRSETWLHMAKTYRCILIREEIGPVARVAFSGSVRRLFSEFVFSFRPVRYGVL